MHDAGVFLFCLGIGFCILTPLLSVLTQIVEGLEYMADAQTQALADLNTAADAVVALLTKLAASAQPDDSAAIHAVAKKLSDAMTAVSAPVPPVPPVAPAA